MFVAKASVVEFSKLFVLIFKISSNLKILMIFAFLFADHTLYMKGDNLLVFLLFFSLSDVLNIHFCLSGFWLLLDSKRV